MSRRSTIRTILLAPFVLAGTDTRSLARYQEQNTRSGPRDNDILVYHLGNDGAARKLTTFERAGVATVARMKDGRLIAAHQHFPESRVDFDKVAVRFSSDEGETWTDARTIRLTGLPEEMRFPFDPTLVPLPDGKIRLYFTSVKGRRIDLNRPAIYSAISSNGTDYTVEPGVRFEVEGRPVIDCAVALHAGVFHLYAPDNGAGGIPGTDSIHQPPRDGVGYHATSTDGLIFTRQPNVKVSGRRRFLGGAVSDGDVVRFFGTGGPGSPGLWMATSENGQNWKPSSRPLYIPGADPGAVKRKDGTWLLVVTGPPRPGTPSANRLPRFERPDRD
jgi:hypothetical protein